VGFRLSRNYLWIYVLLFISWFVKLFVHPAQATSVREIHERMAVGPLAPWVVLLFSLGFFGAMLAALYAAWRTGLPVDEVKGLEMDLEHWKV